MQVARQGFRFHFLFEWGGSAPGGVHTAEGAGGCIAGGAALRTHARVQPEPGRLAKKKKTMWGPPREGARSFERTRREYVGSSVRRGRGGACRRRTGRETPDEDAFSHSREGACGRGVAQARGCFRSRQPRHAARCTLRAAKLCRNLGTRKAAELRSTGSF